MPKSRVVRRALLAGAAVGLVAAGVTVAGGAPSGATVPFGIEVTGNQLTDLSGGEAIQLRGVDRAGGEYACTKTYKTSVFDGPTDAASINAMLSWHINAVRLPLNEDCWLGINTANMNPALVGAAYQQAVEDYVAALTTAHIYVILDLHYTAPGTIAARQQWPMPDEDHSPAFWTQVATTFASNRAVLFDLFNEPFHPTNWACWTNGCTINTFKDLTGSTPTWTAVGLQQLTDVVRATGAQNVIVLGGITWASQENEWMHLGTTTPRISDPLHQEAVDFHTYTFSQCNTPTCWNASIAPLAMSVPVITGEFGETGCTDTFDNQYMTWADAHGVSYLGWAWNATDTGWICSTGPALITDFNGTPTAYGAGLRTHLINLFHSSWGGRLP